MLGIQGLSRLVNRVLAPQAPAVPPVAVNNHSNPAAWQSHHAAFNDLPGRHAGSHNPGIFGAVRNMQIKEPSPLRYIRSNADYSGLPLGPVVAQHADRNTHRVLTPEGYPSGLVVVVEQSPHTRGIPREIERLAKQAEKGIPVPEILSYGNYRGHSALIMRENAPHFAAMQNAARPRW